MGGVHGQSHDGKPHCHHHGRCGARRHDVAVVPIACREPSLEFQPGWTDDIDSSFGDPAAANATLALRATTSLEVGLVRTIAGIERSRPIRDSHYGWKRSLSRLQP
jgi:hypothetical protein